MTTDPQTDRPAVPPTNRAALSAKLWEIAEHHIIAEWICCEPLEPKHTLCAKGYAALSMARSLLVDADPEEAWNPAAPLLDAVLAEMDQLRRDRDLAIAHDRQPYPTAWAYEQACKALRTHRERGDELKQEVRRLGLMVDEYGAGASALTDKLKHVRDLHRETCIAAKGDVSPTAFTCGMCEVLDTPATAAPPAPVDRGAEERLTRIGEWVTSDVVTANSGFGDGYREAQRDIRDLMGSPSRLAAETPGPETQSEAHPPTSTWEVESPRRDNWASWGTTYDERDWAQERYESAIGNAPARPFRLVRATTTYSVEAEHQPAAETPDAPRREPHPTEADLRHALDVAAKFHGRDTGASVGPAASRTTEYRHTCHDQTSAPGRDYDCQWCSTLPESLPAVVAEPGKEA